MDVSMDGLRTSIVSSYNKLADYLNECNKEGDFDYSTFQVNRKELTELMQELKQNLGILLCVYNDKEEHFNLLYDKLNLMEFNEENE
jgi:primosomal protein N''